LVDNAIFVPKYVALRRHYTTLPLPMAMVSRKLE
jgi:hypothetical protein